MWGCCSNKNLEGEEYATCVSCKHRYHLNCLAVSNITIDSKRLSSWPCPECVNNGPKPTKHDSTPARNFNTTRGNKRPAVGSPEVAVAADAAATSLEKVRAIVQEVVNSEFSSMLTQLNITMTSTINKQLEPIKQTMGEIQASMTFMNSRFDDIEAEQTEAKKTMSDLKSENLKMKTDIVDLNHRLSSLEQQARANNLEIQCVPEHKQENLLTIVNTLAGAVGYSLSENNILRCARIAKINMESSRPRSIILQLATPKMRNELLAATISYNKDNKHDKLNSTHLGFAGEKSPIYVVEHLSPANKALHAAARRRAKEQRYKYVWVRDGRVYARKSDNSEYIYVRNMDTLNKIV